jgi:type VI protein secretion system component VasF
VQEEGRPPTPENGPHMRPTRQFRSETEITETESVVSSRKIILWVIVGLAIVVGVVAYFKYAHLLSPLIG